MMTVMSSETVKRAMDGDTSAFGELVRSRWQRLVRIARSIVGFSDAEDAVQDALVIAWKKLGSLRDAGNFEAWVSRIVINRCLRIARKTALYQKHPADHETWHQTDPSAEVDVQRVLSVLSPRQRAVLHLTCVEALPDREAADLLSIRESSVRAHRKRARERLRSIFKELYRDEKR